MGEVEVSSEGYVKLEARQTEEDEQKQIEEDKINKNEDDGSAFSSVVRWERFLPRMVLRILLVEADDSTRQIIVALLRKCSYKVAAVPDGLKAWEVLKGRPRNIDLILTEVELPSISGYALLTLIMEHEICKNIPVIMMSLHDPVSTVYKCMLRGAADFLVKPVRKNELRNLWQHVWRRQVQSNGGGLGQPDESVAQQKVEAAAENNDASNHSSGYIACIQRNRECIEKGNDAQSSCTKPDFEAEGAHIDMQEHSKPKWCKPLSVDMNIQAQEQYVNAEPGVAAKDACPIEKDKYPDTPSENFVIGQASKSNHGVVNSSGEAIDLIGGIDNYQKCSYGSSVPNWVTHKVDSSPFLDLSLRRSHPSGSVNQISDKMHKLNHSDASAFSRYINNAMQPPHSTSPSTCNQQKDYEFNSGKQSSDQALNFNSDCHGPVQGSQGSMIPFINGHPVQTEVAFSLCQQGGFPVPIPARSIRIESLCPAYSSMISPIFCTKSPIHSPTSARHQGPSFQVNSLQSSDPETRNSQLRQKLIGQNANVGSEQTERSQGMELLEYQGHFSSTTDQSANSSFCDGTISCLNSIGCRNNGTFSPVPLGRTAPDYVNDGCSLNHDVSTHQSVQREAALAKFCLKRKERCFEKKVRYASRKKLAEMTLE